VSAFVVDASVVVKWFVPEIHSDKARRLLTLSHEYFAPDVLLAEAANTIWKKVRRRELRPEDGRRLVVDIGRIAVDAIPCRLLVDDACALAVTTERTVYDCLYLALAVRLDALMLTADERLMAGLAHLRPLARHLQLIQTFEG
jgi:predicted nucleic acid-binding protein